MKRFIYIEQDINFHLTTDVFVTYEETLAYSKGRFQSAVRILLGEDYVIPPEHIDADGYADHFGEREEACISEWCWHVYDGLDDTIRGYIEEIEV